MTAFHSRSRVSRADVCCLVSVAAALVVDIVQLNQSLLVDRSMVNMFTASIESARPELDEFDANRSRVKPLSRSPACDSTA